MSGRLVASAIIGACVACVLTIAASAFGHRNMMASILTDPAAWLTVPAVIGAVGGLAAGWLRR